MGGEEGRASRDLAILVAIAIAGSAVWLAWSAIDPPTVPGPGPTVPRLAEMNVVYTHPRREQAQVRSYEVGPGDEQEIAFVD